MSFDLSQAYGTSATRVEEGVKMFFSDNSYFVIARIPNNSYRRELSAQVEKNSLILDLKTPEAEALNESIMAGVLAQTVILGWEGITDKGKPIKYSIENAKKMLLKYDDLVKTIRAFAENINNYREAEEKAIEKKS